MHVGFDKQKSWKREKKLENREEEVIISCFEARTRRSGLTTSTRYRDLIDTQSLASFITAPDTAEPGSAALCVLGIGAVHDQHSQISACIIVGSGGILQNTCGTPQEFARSLVPLRRGNQGADELQEALENF